MKNLKTLLTLALLCGSGCIIAQTTRTVQGGLHTAPPADAKSIAKSVWANRLSTRWQANQSNIIKCKQNAQSNITRKQLPRNNNATAKPQLIATTGDGTELWGSIVYADSWNAAYWRGEYVPFGYYAFKANSENGFEELALDEAMTADGGGVIVNDTLHLVHDVYGYGSHWIVYSAYNVKNWQMVKQQASGDFGLSAFDLALDPVSGKVYGEFSSSDSDKPGFGTVDFTTLEKQVVPMDTTFVGLAFNSAGQLYGINLDGNLYTIDKFTGAYAIVGPTGLKPSTYRQSATFDLATDKLYYTAQTTDNTSGLYEIDTATGKAKLIKMFDDNQEVCGLLVPQRGVTPSSPETVKNLNVAFCEGSLSGTLTFTAPATARDGKSLDGTLEYRIVANGDTLASGAIHPAETKSVSVTVPTAGFYRFDVLTRNASGYSQPARQKVEWIGYDTPIVDIAGFSLDNTTHKASVKWTTRNSGTHTGYIDREALTYSVVRYPGAVVVSRGQTDSVFTETLPAGEAMLYSYAVIADNHSIKSDTAMTEELALGTSRSIPYSEHFDTKGTVGELCTVINSNNDAATWQWSNNGKAVYNSDNAQAYADDWLLTPQLMLEPGRKYNLTFTANGEKGNRLQVKFGQGDNPTDRQQFKVIVKTTEISNATDTLINQEVEVTEAGLYRFAFHATSGPRTGTLSIDDIKVEARSVYGAPQKANDIKVTPAPKAKASAIAAFTAPTTGTDGKALKGTIRIGIYRNSAMIKQFDDVKPGSALSFTDNSPVNGYNTYTFIPYNELGEGERDSVRVFIGQDQPFQPKNLKLTDNLDGSATLSWNAPDTIGVNGGYVDSTRVDYEIFYGNYTQYSPDTVMHGKTRLDMTMRQDGFQSNLYFNVKAKTVQGKSELTESNLIVEGEPYRLPFKESFPTGNYETVWWRDYATADNSFRFNLGISSDNDNGSIYWYPTKASSEGEVCSGKIDISTAAHPQLSFDYFVIPGFDGQWEVSICKDGRESHTVWTADMTKDKSYERWEKARIDLTHYRDANFITIKFRAVSHQLDNQGMFLDNIAVQNINGHDMAIELAAPKTARRGKPNKMSVTVKNAGKYDETGATLTVTANGGEIFCADMEQIKEGADTTLVIEYIPNVAENALCNVVATVTLTGDEDDSNNSASASVGIADNSYPKPHHLRVTAASDGGNMLTWAEPESTENNVNDDFEDYASWTTTDIGDWTTRDFDQKQTYSIGNLYFPHAGEPYAFMVFCPEEIGLDTELAENANMKPHSGSQYLACFDAVGAKNDDWLVSPELSGEAQTVSFYAKNIGTVSGSFVERFNVLYSLSGTETSDFQLLTPQPVSATDEWTEYSFNLPEGTRHFALQLVSEDQFALLIDDIVYKAPALKLKGYNIYCEGKLAGFVPAGTTNFADTGKDATANTPYCISAVYDAGESGLSVTTSVSGITTTTTTSSNGVTARYRLDGTATSTVNGIQIIKMKNGSTRKAIVKP